MQIVAGHFPASFGPMPQVASRIKQSVLLSHRTDARRNARSSNNVPYRLFLRRFGAILDKQGF